MAYDLTRPSLQDKRPTEDIRDLKTYLVTLIDQLNYIVSDLDKRVEELEKTKGGN